MKARSFVEDARIFDAVVVLLASWFVIAAYVDAWAFVNNGPTVLLGPAGEIAVDASWFALTGFLVVAFARSLRVGRPWNRALPDGYMPSLFAALIFGAAVIVDKYWSIVFGNGLGLDVLFRPPHLIEIAAAAFMVSGPLRAAARRGETSASPVTLLSAALLLSVVTFATQFAHPLIDLWSAHDFAPRTAVLTWVAENLGVASILAQTAILVGTALLMSSAFKLRPGSLTFVFTVNGALVTLTKLHFQLIPVAILTGLAADLLLLWASRRPGRPAASLGAVVGGSFAFFLELEVVVLEGGTAWALSLVMGTVMAAAMLGWLMGRLLPAGLPSAMMAVPKRMPWEPAETHWTRDPESTVRPQLVKAALDDLGSPEALARSPLALLPGVSRGGSAASDLRAVLVDVIDELASSTAPRDVEAGRLLLDYYVKRVGSHEVIMERLHLSRPTFYRRLQRGFALVAERLDELSEFAGHTPVRD